MVLSLPKKYEISSSLRDILNHLDEDSQRPPEPYSYGHESFSQVDGNNEDNFGLDNDGFENCGTWDVNQDDEASIVDEGVNDGDPILSSQNEVPHIFGRLPLTINYLFTDSHCCMLC